MASNCDSVSDRKASPERHCETIEPMLELAPGETNKAYVARIFSFLYEEGRIPNSELHRLSGKGSLDAEYRLRTFGFSRPLFVRSEEERCDARGYPRYYAKPICNGLYLCKEWYFSGTNTSYNLDKFQAWAHRMLVGAAL